MYRLPNYDAMTQQERASFYHIFESGYSMISSYFPEYYKQLLDLHTNTLKDIHNRYLVVIELIQDSISYQEDLLDYRLTNVYVQVV